MKICVDVQGSENIHIPTIHIPNTLLRSKTFIRKMLDKVDLDLDEEKIDKITEHVSDYVRQYKGCQLVEVEVYSKDDEYVHVEITV